MKILIRRLIEALTVAIILVGIIFAAELAFAIHGKKEPPFINPSHRPIYLGNTGSTLVYVVIGDSTGAGRGAPYGDGIAVGTARHLALQHKVEMTNLSISGAVAADVVSRELTEAAILKPDVVLLSVGANDATHFASAAALKANLELIIDTLRKASPNVAIVVTGCPQMGSVPRFLQPLRWFAGTQTNRINAVFAEVVGSRRVVWAHIADETGPIFSRDPTLFAEDQFHPNQRGYAVWIPILNRALDSACSILGLKN